MSNTEMIIYLVLFLGVTLAIVIPVYRWYNLNMGMVQKKRHVKILVAVIILSLLAAVIHSIVV